MVMGKLKRAAPEGTEVHHIYGRIGRLAACERYCINLKPPPGSFNHHDLPTSVLLILREKNREDYQAFQAANKQNGDETKCWYVDCHHHYFRECPLAEGPPKGEER